MRAQPGRVEVVVSEAAEAAPSVAGDERPARGPVDVVGIFKARGWEVGCGDGVVSRGGEGVGRRVGVWLGRLGEVRGELWRLLRRGLLTAVFWFFLLLFGVAFFVKGGEEALNDGDFEEGGEVLLGR